MTALDIKVDLSGVQPLFKKVRDPALVQNALKAGALYLKGKASVYPPVRRKRVAQYWTDKQRRFFFYALKANLIQVPYRRGSSPGSQRLAQRWAIAIRGNSAVLGNNATYAKLVLGRKAEQSLYHRGNWDSVEDVVKKHGAETARIVRAAYIASLKR
jgi:hypothetical protein